MIYFYKTTCHKYMYIYQKIKNVKTICIIWQNWKGTFESITFLRFNNNNNNTVYSHKHTNFPLFSIYEID